MTLLFPALLGIAALLSLPALRRSRRRGAESRWLLFSSLPALVLWIALTAVGYGAQSLSNIIEVFWLVCAGVVLGYVKVFAVDRSVERPRATTFGLMAVLALGAVLLRSFMPLLPE